MKIISVVINNLYNNYKIYFVISKQPIIFAASNNDKEMNTNTNAVEITPAHITNTFCCPDCGCLLCQWDDEYADQNPISLGWWKSDALARHQGHNGDCPDKHNYNVMFTSRKKFSKFLKSKGLDVPLSTPKLNTWALIFSKEGHTTRLIWDSEDYSLHNEFIWIDGKFSEFKTK